MPAPGDQYYGGDAKNPFEERVVSGFTAQEIATLQSRLNKQLGPEYISQRPGNGGGKVAYLEGNKAIALANEVFGFNGWSSSLGQVQIDYVDELQNGKVSLGLSIVVRITLKDGTYHEDIGYGSIENGKGKAASFEKAKKEAATDGLKRALRTFGNVLGNCLYDKEYLKKVQTMKVKPVKFIEDKLYRHADFAPRVEQTEQKLLKQEPHTTPSRPNQVLRTRTEHLAQSFSADFDDEFDGNLFDGVDVGEQNSFRTASTVDTPAPKALEVMPRTNGDGRNNVISHARTSPIRNTRPQPQQPHSKTQPATAQSQQGPQHAQQTPVRPIHNVSNGRPPRIPVQQKNRAKAPAVNADNAAVVKPIGHQQQSTSQSGPNQGSRPPHPPVQQPPVPQRSIQQAQGCIPAPMTPAAESLSVGFVSLRTAALSNKQECAPSLDNLPAFNPNAESAIPEEKRTPGINYKRSAPITREAVGAPPGPQSTQPPARSLTPGAGQGGSFSRPTNFVNPHQDVNRRIGMPFGQQYAMSPGGNRGAYKPPTFANGDPPSALKRPALQDVSNTGATGNPSVEGSDVKRQRIEAPTGGVENRAPVTT